MLQWLGFWSTTGRAIEEICETEGIYPISNMFLFPNVWQSYFINILVPLCHELLAAVSCGHGSANQSNLQYFELRQI